MRSTFTKIFLSFWLAQTLIGLCTIFISMRQFEGVAIGYTSSFAMMQTIARESIRAYESGGCAALNKIPNTFFLDKQGPSDQPAILFDPSDQPLCQQIDKAGFATVLKKIRKEGFLPGERRGPAYLVGIQVNDALSRKYVYVERGTFPTQISIPFRDIVPRILIGLLVSIVVTFGIALLITRPIGTLRAAARQLAAGNLKARAKFADSKPNSKTGDELRGLVDDFNGMAERLESLVDSHKLLLRDVSHELRSPLSRLSVALEWAREEAEPGIEEQLDRMESEVVRLNTLIGQLLSLSHLESTVRLPVHERFSLASVVEELLPNMEYEAQRRSCDVKFDTDSSTITEVAGNQELMARAVENVIRNAISYTREGSSVEIVLSDRLEGGKNIAILRVRDHGPGVPEQDLKSIFEPFYRSDNSRQRSTGGFGVGLAITERAVQLHCGQVFAANHSEGGLVIQICIPCAPTIGR